MHMIGFGLHNPVRALNPYQFAQAQACMKKFGNSGGHEVIPLHSLRILRPKPPIAASLLP